MCDYCDCRSHAPIAELSADHERLLDDLAALRRAAAAGDDGGARAALGRLRPLLEAHAAREEQGVFHELVAADAGAGYVEAFRAEHDRLHTLVAAAGSPRWREATAELCELLADHIAREERDLFPAAHQLLQPSQWDAVDAVHGGVPT
jgi:hypothetical protein